MPAGGFATSIEVTGLERALTVARRVRYKGGDPRELLVIAGGIMEASILRRFETGRGPGGIPWPPLKPRTLTKRRGKGARILVDTGDLQASIRYVVSGNSVEAGSDGLTNPVKALANQFGSHRQTVVVRHRRRQTQIFGVTLGDPLTVTVRGHGRVTNLPARPFVGVDDEDRRDILEEWQGYLVRLFR